MITHRQLAAIMIRLEPDRIAEYVPPLNAAMAEYKIDTIIRAAAFLGQLALESGELRWWVEWSNGMQYNGRKDLGNGPNDGPRYKGRSPIQLTGRANYRAAGADLGIDLEGQPELAAHPDVGFRIAGWYWDLKSLNELADERDYREITKRINGGYRHIQERYAYYYRALEVLTVGIPINAGLTTQSPPHQAPQQ
jgi:putative chitinase